jgi:gamma-glutamyltranspeptidase / glutathione hydrolase
VQVLLNLLRGWTPQAALDAPRFCISAAIPDADLKAKTEEDSLQESAGDINSEVYFEEGISPDKISKLRGVSCPRLRGNQSIQRSQKWVMTHTW